MITKKVAKMQVVNFSYIIEAKNKKKNKIHKNTFNEECPTSMFQ